MYPIFEQVNARLQLVPKKMREDLEKRALRIGEDPQELIQRTEASAMAIIQHLSVKEALQKGIFESGISNMSLKQHREKLEKVISDLFTHTIGRLIKDQQEKIYLSGFFHEIENELKTELNLNEMKEAEQKENFEPQLRLDTFINENYCAPQEKSPFLTVLLSTFQEIVLTQVEKKYTKDSVLVNAVQRGFIHLFSHPKTAAAIAQVELASSDTKPRMRKRLFFEAMIKLVRNDFQQIRKEAEFFEFIEGRSGDIIEDELDLFDDLLVNRLIIVIDELNEAMTKEGLKHELDWLIMQKSKIVRDRYGASMAIELKNTLRLLCQHPKVLTILESFEKEVEEISPGTEPKAIQKLINEKMVELCGGALLQAVEESNQIHPLLNDLLKEELQKLSEGYINTLIDLINE